MENHSISSFLEVTINSSKLNELLNMLAQSSQSNDKKMSQLNVQIKNISNEYQRAKNNIDIINKSTEQFQKNTYLQIESIKNQLTRMMVEVTKRIDRLEIHLGQTRNQMRIQYRQSFNGVQKKLSSLNLQKQNLKVAQSQQICLLSQKIEKLNSQISQLKIELNKVLIKKQTQENQQRQQEQDYNDSIMMKTTKKSIKISRASIKRQQKQKKNSQVYIIDQKTKQEKQQINQNSYKNQSILIRNTSQINQQQLNAKQQIQLQLKQFRKNQIKNIQDLNIKKFTKIQQSILLNNKSLNQIIEQLKTKLIVFDQKILMLSRKLDKQIYKTNQLKNNIKSLQINKFDQKILDNFRHQIQRAKNNYQIMINNKIDKQIYQKQKNKIYQKILIIQENIIQKVDKVQIKKALIFLQNKIKQIIIIVTEKGNQEKQGALTKIPMKCLSCDKDIQKNLEHQQDLFKKSKKKSIRLTSRCQSSHIRRQIRFQNMNINSSINNE